MGKCAFRQIRITCTVYRALRPWGRPISDSSHFLCSSEYTAWWVETAALTTLWHRRQDSSSLRKVSLTRPGTGDTLLELLMLANERKRQHKHQEFKSLTRFLSAPSEFKTPNPTAAHSFTVWSKVTAVSLWCTVPVFAENTCFPLVCQPLKYAMLCASLIWASLIWAVYILTFPLIAEHFRSVVDWKRCKKVFQYFFYSIWKKVVMLEIHGVIAVWAVT